MGEKKDNICCKYLLIMPCNHTPTHRHFYCDCKYQEDGITVDNQWVKSYCIANFADCKYLPPYTRRRLGPLDKL